MTLPEGPFGRAKVPSSAPLVIARLRCDRLTGVVASTPNFSVMYYNVDELARCLDHRRALTITFLICERETPPRSFVSTMHA